ncbi:MAG TPA: hypothetical protein VGE72_01905 [Azospirillum sp.]
MAIDPEALAHALEALGIAWATADGAARLKERTARILHAEIANAYRDTVRSAEGRHDLATAHPRYRETILAAEELRTAANVARARYEALQAKIELIRTRAATERAAMTLR